MEPKNVTPGKPRVTGAIFRASAGTPVPTDATSQLDPAFKELGYVNDQGVRNANTAEKTKVYAWGGNAVMDSTTQKPDDWIFTLIEALNPEVLKTVYGDANVIVSDDGKTISVMATAEDLAEFILVIDMALTNNALKRIVIPKGVLSNVAEIAYVDNQPIGYNITVSAYYDASGKSHYEYILKPGDANTASVASDEPAEENEA